MLRNVTRLKGFEIRASDGEYWNSGSILFR